MSFFIDLTGRVFGRLTVLSKDGSKNTHAVWKVECVCGSEFSTIAVNLISKNTAQCKKCFHESQRVLTDLQVKEMAKLRASGMSYQKIANLYNVGRTTAYNNINKLIIA